MKVVRLNDVAKIPYEHPLFTGPDVTVQVLAPEEGEHDVNVVHFGRGVRNKFHAHSADQILIITGGEGIVATENEERVVTVGEVVFFPAGEKHWHGATETSDFSHIYIMRKGSELTQLED